MEPDSKVIHTRRADTNVISLQFNRLQEKVNVHTGDPIVCKNSDCAAVLSHLSRISGEGESKVRFDMHTETLKLWMYVC